MQFVHGRELRAGLRFIRTLTAKPIGFNAIVEKSSRVYEDRIRRWVAIALEEGVRFFITALGNPRWVVDAVHGSGGIVYHDVTDRRWALKALDHGVDGLICVNARAGGHAGALEPGALLRELSDLGVPLVCAGGVGDEGRFVEALRMGYDAVQMGTRFIATDECRAHDDYKRAILDAVEDDIVLTEKISGVPVAVIRTPFVERTGTRAGFVMKRMLRHPKLKHYARMLYTVRSIWQLKHAALQGAGYRDYFQAGRSVSGIRAVEPTRAIVARFAAALAADRERGPVPEAAA
jgi:nitronate monooxygenase